MGPFRVIIIGGSVAGLTLANILEQYGIDFVVLEKHETIAPQLGAGFAIMPNGARILDQLGCYEALAKNNEPVNSIWAFDQDGILRGGQPEMGRWMEESFGYKMRFMDRQQAVRGIFDNLRDKSKVRKSCGAVKIESGAYGVTVETTDGSVFHGDIVVGADGIHSCVKQEMQRLAAEETPGRDLFPEKDSFLCTYGGFFGISKAPKGVIQDQAFRNIRERRTYLCAGGPDGTLYWILIFKNDEKQQGNSIRNYTEADRQRLLAMCQDDVVRPGITFADIYKGQIQSAIVPLEEGVLKTCFYGRMVLIGDSWHKIHPLSGLGGNNAIISAAALADELKRFVDANEAVNRSNLESAFRNYQKVREAQARRVSDVAHLMSRMDTLDNPLFKFMYRHLLSHFGMELPINTLGQIFAPAVCLKHLPLVPRHHLMPFNDEAKIKSKPRSVLANRCWITLLASIGLIYYLLVRQNDPTFVDQAKLPSVKKYWGTVEGFLRPQLHLHMSMAVVTPIICLESYRQFFSVKLPSSAIPFSLASLFIGWEVLAPIYFAIFIYLTAPKASYYPSARALDIVMVTSIRWAWLITYVPVFIYTLRTSTFPTWAWTIAHATLPLTTRLFRKWTAYRYKGPVSSPALLWGAKDVPLIASFMKVIHVTQYTELSTTDFNTWKTMLDIYSNGYKSVVSGDSARAILLDCAITIFCIFAYWDLRRVGASSSKFWPHLFSGIFLGAVFSPAMTLALLWGHREVQWSEARQKKDTARDV